MVIHMLLLFPVRSYNNIILPWDCQLQYIRLRWRGTTPPDKRCMSGFNTTSDDCSTTKACMVDDIYIGSKESESGILLLHKVQKYAVFEIISMAEE